jgi:hypothetical protein
MAVIPQRAQVLAQTLLHNLPTALEIGKNASGAALSFAKPSLDTAPAVFQAFMAALKEIFARAFEHVRPVLLNLLMRGQEAFYKGFEHIKPALMDVTGTALRLVTQHTKVAAVIGVYALLGAVRGPLWPLAVVLRIFGFGLRGVAPGKYSACDLGCTLG